MKTNQQSGKELRASDISGIQKAALLMIALNVETASQVLKFLDPADIELIDRKSVV